MTELIVAVWALSAVLLFLPVGRVGRFALRRLGLGGGRAAPAGEGRWETLELSPGDPGERPRELVAAAVGEQTDVDPASEGLAPPALQEEVVATALGPDGPPDGNAASTPPTGDGRDGAAGQPASRSARGLAWAGRWAAGITIYVVFVVTSIYLVPRLLVEVLDSQHPMAAITSQSMYPTLKEGDLVLIEGLESPSDVHVGDIIAFEHDGGFAIHRVVERDGSVITTKGDANPDPDPPISFDDVIGRAVTVGGRLAKVPYLGNIPILFGGTSEVADLQERAPVFEGEGDPGGSVAASS